MQVIEFIKNNGLEALETLGIKYKDQDGMLLLNYDQIESPKTNPVVMECRSLVLNSETLAPVSRAFIRFFNYGEAPEITGNINISESICFEKLDGSLIIIWYFNGLWRIRTRQTIDASATVQTTGKSYRQSVIEAIFGKDGTEEQFQEYFEKYNTTNSYVFEYVGPDNRIVTKYTASVLYLLSIFDNETGEELIFNDDGDYVYVGAGGNFTKNPFPFVKCPQTWKFKNDDECATAVNKFDNLEEGFVICNPKTGLRVKMKSNLYVQAHHIRGEGLSPKRILNLILSRESEEYLAYYPEHKQYFEEKEVIINEELTNAFEVYEKHKHIESQKEFAIAIKDEKFKAVMFSARLHDCNFYTEFDMGLTVEKKSKYWL